MSTDQKRDDGGSAFPSPTELSAGWFSENNQSFGATIESIGGMTLRDYFAAKILASELQTVFLGMALVKMTGNADAAVLEQIQKIGVEECVTRAWKIADQMLAARKS